jgi:hypothetical protein
MCSTEAICFFKFHMVELHKEPLQLNTHFDPGNKATNQHLISAQSAPNSRPQRRFHPTASLPTIKSLPVESGFPVPAYK